MSRHLAWVACGLCALCAAWGCSKEAPFPDQIPTVVATLGQFHESWSEKQRAPFDSVCTDRELYDALADAFEDDSLAVLSRRIHNPIDSADVVMTVGRYSREKAEMVTRYELELFMRREGDQFWIVAHRLKRSLP